MFNTWLLSKLKEKEWSQADLARASGLTTAAISKYINGRIPDAEALKKIARAFRLPNEQVFEAAGVFPTELTTLETQETDLLTQIEKIKAQTISPPAPYTAQQIQVLSKFIPQYLKAKEPAIIRQVLLGIIVNITIDRIENHAIGIINISLPKAPPLPEGEEQNHAIITAPSLFPPVGAPIHTRSIPFEYAIQTKRPRS